MSLLQRTIPFIVGAAGGVAFVLSCGGPAASPAADAAPSAADAPGAPAPPVVVMGPMKTADTDLSRLVRGSLSVGEITPSGGTKVTDGPVVVTDLGGEAGYSNATQFATFFVAPMGDDCRLSDASSNLVGSVLRASGNGMDIHGARLVVNAGETLCVYEGSLTMSIAWSGFRPYD